MKPGRSSGSSFKKDADEETLLKAMLMEYEVDEETAEVGIASFLNKLREADLLE